MILKLSDLPLEKGGLVSEEDMGHIDDAHAHLLLCEALFLSHCCSQDLQGR